MDSSSQNWLGFSLSNPSHFSLFHAFDSHSSPQGGLVEDKGENLNAPASATDLSIFPGRPKLENFLGGSTTTGVSAPSPACFSAENEIYDSELKTIASSFLRGYAATQGDSINQFPVTEHLPMVQSEHTAKKALDTFGQRTSIYRGVTRHRWTGRYEAHLWDNSCRREGQSRKGRQVYLGGYDKEDKAARAYDLAAVKYWGPTTTVNFPVSNYEKEVEEMKNMTRQEFVASLRRKSSGFSRGASIYRGVTRHHQHGRWQARIGRVAGNKDLYLGTFSTQEEAAEAYDIAAIKFRGLNAVTNFDMSRYDVKSIASSHLPIGGMTGKSKSSSDSFSDSKSLDGTRSDGRDHSSSSSSTFISQPNFSTLTFAVPIKQDPSDNYWPMVSYQNSSILNSRNPNPPFSMDIPPASAFDESYNIHLQNGSHPNQISTQFSTPICLNSDMNTYEDSNNPGYGNLVGQTMYSKPNFFQSAIFGVE